MPHVSLTSLHFRAFEIVFKSIKAKTIACTIIILPRKRTVFREKKLTHFKQKMKHELGFIFYEIKHTLSVMRNDESQQEFLNVFSYIASEIEFGLFSDKSATAGYKRG